MPQYLFTSVTQLQDISLIHVITGSLTLSQKTIDGEEEDAHMFTAHSGDIVGGLAVITGEPSFFTVKAKHQSRIALISKDNCYRFESFFLAIINTIFIFISLQFIKG